MLLWPLTLPYRIVVGLRNQGYDRGWLPARRLPARVISIGNLTAGGTGKTPLVIWATNRLLAEGRTVAVLSRGYRRNSRQPLLLVSDGRTTLAGPEAAGDEPYLIAQRCPRAVVAVGADRAALGAWVLERCGVDTIVLDDGFQHRGVARDADLLLVDATDQDGLRGLLPAGRLREPLTAARRATAIVITRADDAAAAKRIAGRLEAALGRPSDPILVRFVADACVTPSGRTQPMEWLKGRRVFGVCGIANDASFEQLVRRQGADLAGMTRYRDHHAYTAGDVAALKAERTRHGAEALVTTEKDMVKLIPFIGPDDPVYAVRLAVRVEGGDERLARALAGGRP